MGGSLEVLVPDLFLLLRTQLLELVGDLGDVLGDRHVADAHARTRLVDEVNRLIRQETILHVAVGELDGRLDCRIGEVHAVMRLVMVLEAIEDLDGLLDGGLLDHDRLETTGKRGVLLDVLAVLVRGRRADHLDFAT